MTFRSREYVFLRVYDTVTITCFLMLEPYARRREGNGDPDPDPSQSVGTLIYSNIENKLSRH